MRRFVVFDRAGDPLFDLDGRIESCVRTEVLNGEHKLDVVTTQPLEEGMRILVRDGTGRWREWVVDETDEAHEGGRTTVGTYGCTWSMQYDLATEEGGELWPGTYDPISAAAALSMVLGSDSAWEVGSVTVAGLNGTSLYDGSRWEYLSKLLDTWGGEMEPRIVVDANGVTNRYVDWLAHVGSEVAQRRYDYGGDCDAIRRKGAPGPRYCRIVPRGGRDATDNDGVKYSERCGVEEEPYQADSMGEFVHPANADYIEDTVAALDFRVPDGHGGWRYPTKVVCYDLDYAGDQEELLAKAMEDAPNHTRPKATYEVSVRQYAPAGIDPHGTQLGDEVHVVDATFGEAPLRIEARVVEVQVNELDEADAQLTIGEYRQTMASAFKSLRSAIDAAEERTRRIEGAGTLVYLQTLLEQLNEEINATGGYAYLAQGEGIIVYDIAVDDPLVGYNSATQTWASQVVQIKGGNIRIANEKNASFAGINDWKWKTLLVSGHLAAELVTAVNVVTGWLGNANGTFIDLDNNTANFGPVSGYHFTVDVNGIRHWYGNTLLGHYLDSEMQIGKTAEAHIVADASGIELFDASAVSEAIFSGSTARVGRSDKAHITVTPSTGIELFDSNNVSVLFAGLSGSNSIVRVGKASGSGNVVMSSEGYVDIRNASTVIAHFGYGEGRNYWGQAIYAPYYTLGTRKASSEVDSYSVVEGYNNTASNFCSHAEGSENVATSRCSHVEGYACTSSNYCAHAEGENSTASGWVSHAEGSECTASGSCAHAGGNNCTASGLSSFAHGEYCVASKGCSTALGSHTVSPHGDSLATGRYNVSTGENLFVVGCGYADSDRRNALSLSQSGDLWIRGSFTQNSDRRLKEHHAYLADDAEGFVRKLRPALFTKDGERHVGFYAQDVRDAEPEEWGTVTVTAQHTDESLGFDPLTLDYTALIAPLVAYAQGLERRIDQQQRQIDKLSKRLTKLEGGR